MWLKSHCIWKHACSLWLSLSIFDTFVLQFAAGGKLVFMDFVQNFFEVCVDLVAVSDSFYDSLHTVSNPLRARCHITN